MIYLKRAPHALMRGARTHHEVFDKELAPAIEQVSQCDFSFRGVEDIFLFHFDPGKLAAMPAYLVAQVR
jgi:hypothetical protein